MAIDSFAAFVLEQLDVAGQGPIDARRMFGSLGLYRHDTIFGIVSRGHLYLKVDDATRPTYEARGMGPFRPSARQTIKSYYEVPVDVLEDPETLSEWVDEALRHAAS